MSEPRYIPNSQLRAGRLPPPGSDWELVQRFALTFDGYKHCGSVARCATIANRRRNGEGGHENLSELRSCLFFEQRRYHHCGYGPEREDMNYIHSLLEDIRARVKAASDLLA